MSGVWHFYDASTGVFLRGSMLLPNQAAVEANTPEGHVATEMVVDPATQRMDVQTGELVPYTPPAPVFVWDAPTARAERDRRMDATIGVTLKAFRTGQPIPADWAAYMQALADVPQQPGFPESITWPPPPAS